MSPALASPIRQPSPAARQQWSRGVELAKQGDLAAAAGHFERATRLAPAVALYWLNLASALRKLQRGAPALAAARRAFELDRASGVACHLLAQLLHDRGQDDQALHVLHSLDPAAARDGRHHLLAGAALMALGRHQEAIRSFVQVLAGQPDLVEAHMQLGFAFARLQRYGDAAECFRTAALVEPAQFGAAVYAAHYAAWACDWAQEAGDRVRLAESLALQPEGGEMPSFSPFCLLAMADDPQLHAQTAALQARRLAADARRAGAFAPAARWPAAEAALAGGRIRVGFVSADFRTHATSMLLVQTLERLPRERFEVVLYSHGDDDGTPLRRRMEAAADPGRFVDCRAMSAAEQARRIRDDGIAILVDLSGYTANTRIGVFALRPAPVQALWLAYPGTSGADFIDYLIGDPVLTPLAHAQDFSEKIAQLPVTYEPTDELRAHPEPLSRAGCGLPEDAFVFACFNQSYKISDEVFSCWCRILNRVPGSVLWLLVPQDDIRQALRERAAERALDPARLVFADFVDPTVHLARLPQADLFLDTFPYGAHTTCSDALWMGLPVLTRIGLSFPARVAASLLHAVGLPELAVGSAQDYEDKAVALATDRGALERLRDHLWDGRRDLPLFDNERFTRELAALFERMAGRWQQGLAPEALAAA